MLAPMGSHRLRALAIVAFAAGAVLAGIGNSTHARWLVALAFACFLLGVLAFFRWRRATRARVFAPEEKTRD
jgi:peptidoglycan/LPS O-acetylase OafA/YrhL